MAGPRDVVVAIDGSEYVALAQWTGRELGRWPAADEAFAAALAATSDGGELRVGSGEYRLTAPLALATNLRLVGSGRTTRLVPAPGVSAAITASGVRGAEVANLLVSGRDGATADAGIVADDCRDLRIDNVMAVGLPRYGIWLRENTSLSRVSGCTLAGNADANLRLESLSDGGDLGDFVPNLINDCVLFGGGRGVALTDSLCTNIVGCVAYQTNGTAFHVSERSQSCVLSGCRTFQITGEPIIVEESDEVNVTGNTLAWHTGAGVIVRGARWGTVTGNVIIDSGSVNPGGSIFGTRVADWPEPIVQRNGIDIMDSRGITVTSNSIFNWGVAPKLDHGILEDERSRFNVLSSNSVNYFDGSGVTSHGTGSVAKHNVCFPDEPHRMIGDLENMGTAEAMAAGPPGTFLSGFDTERVAALVAQMR